MKATDLFASAAAAALALLAFPSFGQSLRAYEKKAEEAYEARDYAAALAYHEVLLEVDSQRVDALFKSGEAARHLRAFELAEKYLTKIPDDQKTGLYAATDFRIASVKKGLEKYGEAAAFFKKYLEAHAGGNDPDQSGQGLLVQRARQELEYCEWAMERLQNPDPVEIARLGDHVNSVHSDFAPFRFADRLYFTSAYQLDTADAPVERIFSAIQENEKRLAPENTEEKNAHSSNFTLTADGRRMYYTICQSTEVIHEYRCEIWYRDREYEGGWDKPKRLPDFINLDSATTTMPSVGLDKMLGKEVLFFASNRPGGKGNLDLWASVIEADGVTFGQPFPLPFNTPQDDITPFFHQQSQTLFFSSGGLQNLGGYDIFSTKKTPQDDWSEPLNLGHPLNSSCDDLYFTFNSGAKRAYFASNRPGCLCADPTKACKCPDIYEARILLDLSTWIFNAVDSSELTGVCLELLDLATGKVDTFQVNPGGNKFLFPLDLEKNYRITASLPGWLPDSDTVRTEGMTHTAHLERLLYLTPKIDLVVSTFNAIDSTALNGTLVQLDLSPFRARPETSGGQGGGGQSLSNQNHDFTNRCEFPLSFGKHYSASASKPAYGSDEARISTVGMNRPDTLFQDLYLSPFQGLPLVLYFDNAKPSPEYSGRDTTTTLTYGDTYRAYLERKPVFLKKYAAGLSGQARLDAREEVRSFFENEVEANYNQLETFCGILRNYLKTGKRIEILLEGYASPLASPEYNRRLSERRISSLVNHFRQWKKGGLLPFFANGQLEVRRAPKGEEQETGGVSDDEGNRRISEYSPAASRLRRVTIAEIRAMRSEEVTKLN